MFWAGPGLAVSIALGLWGNLLAVLLWNLSLSIYTIALQHALGCRQESPET